MTSRIRALPPKVVDVIAAGEVVERPASVVKELVENSLDAGARRIEVTVEEGGRTLLRVEDDGEGMGAEDLAPAFAPHATSKIRGVDDLEGVATYGFRGEALASIGAVAEASLASRRRGARSGHRIENRRGDLGEPAPAAHPEGTTAEVRNLFGALPARRKFLRSPATEAARVTEVVGRFALHRPDVAFLLRVDGREVLRAPAGEPPRERAARVLGRERMETLLPVKGGAEGVAVEGFVASPDAAEKGRPPQYLSVNGRAVSDRTVAHAVRSALEGLVTVHRQPAWVLSITLPAAEVDVNVHPAKSEVRFRRPSRVHDAVAAAVRSAVLAGEQRPSLSRDLTVRTGVRAALDKYLGTARGNAVAGEIPFGTTPDPAMPSAASPSLGAATPRPATAGDGVLPVLQVRNAFLVFETAEGIAVVDQHALHERVLLERLHARAESGAVEIQRLLVPEILDCGPAEAALAEAAAGTLRKAGLLLERFGPGSVAIHGVPRALAGRPLRPLAEGVLRRLREEKAVDGDALLHGVLESMACHGAVKAGDPLRPEEARALLDAAKGLEAAGHCAHGRPTELRIPFEDLEKRFRRRNL